MAKILYRMIHQARALHTPNFSINYELTQIYIWEVFYDNTNFRFSNENSIFFNKLIILLDDFFFFWKFAFWFLIQNSNEQFISYWNAYSKDNSPQNSFTKTKINFDFGHSIFY